MRADRSPSTQSLPMVMGCDRQEHTAREQGDREQRSLVFYYIQPLAHVYLGKCGPPQRRSLLPHGCV